MITLDSFKKKELKMVWKVEGEGKERGYLVGSAHFFPYPLRSSIKRLLNRVDTVLLEGPLDEGNMEKVIEQGSKESNTPSLYEALDPGTIKVIQKTLAPRHDPLSSFANYSELFQMKKEDPWVTWMKESRPWMTFFAIWTHFLRQQGWRFSIDLEAYRMASAQSKKIHFLETIEEQLEALDGIPLANIVAFMERINLWGDYPGRFVKNYLNGDYESWMADTIEFPTRCPSIIERRDPVLFARMVPFFKSEKTIAFIGISHINGVTQFLRKAGYSVEREIELGRS